MRKLLPLFLVLALLSYTPVRAQAAPDAFVLGGQSNMSKMFALMESQLQSVYGPDALGIRCAVNGSSITAWQRGQSAYENCVTKTEQAITDGYLVRGILFSQGERDSYDAITAPQWKALFYSFAHDFRQDAGLPSTLPVFYAQLGTLPTDRARPYWQSISNQQQAAMIGHVNLHMVATAGLAPYLGNGPHYSDYGPIADAYMDVITQVLP